MTACAVCGSPVSAPFRAPQPEGAPDLDGRPGEPARSTLPNWVQTCRSCGACAPNLAVAPATAAETIRTDAYRALASPFMRWAALSEGAERAEALLQAAWSVEDAGGDGAPLRRQAVAIWPKPFGVEAVLRLADIQRRAGMLTEAAATLATLPLDAGPIAVFERARVAAGDTGRHMLSSALRPPARMPHVAHGKRAASGFWGRLLGTGRP